MVGSDGKEFIGCALAERSVRNLHKGRDDRQGQAAGGENVCFVSEGPKERKPMVTGQC